MDSLHRNIVDVISLMETPIYRRLLVLLHQHPNVGRNREIVEHVVTLMNSTSLHVIPMHRNLVRRLRELLPAEIRSFIVENRMAPENLDVNPIRLPPIHPRGRGRRNPRVCPTCKRA